MCLGIEPGAAGWKVQTNPLSYGRTPQKTYFLVGRIQSSQSGDKPYLPKYRDASFYEVPQWVFELPEHWTSHWPREHQKGIFNGQQGHKNWVVLIWRRITSKIHRQARHHIMGPLNLHLPARLSGGQYHGRNCISVGHRRQEQDVIYLAYEGESLDLT